ncbi:MAG: GerMN domain-containing protein [Spirochaetia bacterium]|nr:GerMN domain-containing protein [Spirochaetia bacterium]
MKPMKRSMILLILALFALAAAGVYFLLGERSPAKEVQRKAAVQAAKRWIRNYSPTFVYDGTGLELREVERKDREGEGAVAYEMRFEFESRHAGYGDREGEILAQVITPHTLEIQVERDPNSGRWKVVRAVTDGVFDERAGEFLEEPEERETKRVNLYFMRVTDGVEEAVPVSRDIPTAGSLEVNALEALLKGPRPEEGENDYYSSIPEGVEIEQFEIQDGRAHVSFSAELERNVAGSARVQAIREQIRLTLRQFEQIETVEIAVEGKTEGILQP